MCINKKVSIILACCMLVMSVIGNVDYHVAAEKDLTLVLPAIKDAIEGDLPGHEMIDLDVGQSVIIKVPIKNMSMSHSVFGTIYYEEKYELASNLSEYVSVEKIPGVNCDNVFFADGASDYELIRSVSFQRCIMETDGIDKTGEIPYEIRIWKGFDEIKDNKHSGGIITQRGTIPFSGYYTIPLEEPFLVKKGDKFAVEIRLNEGQEMVDAELGIGYEDFGFLSSSGGCVKGQSYLLSSWGYVDNTSLSIEETEKN